jgi:fumarylpyruvate hydrolase
MTEHTMRYLFDPPLPASVPVAGRHEHFPVHRIYCVGRNYAEHAKEMGATPERGTPMFFMKPADALVIDGADVPYPSGTTDLHHEVEMVVALQRGGRDIALADTLDHVYGLRRRPRPHASRSAGRRQGQRPSLGHAKGFDASAPISALRPAAEIGHPPSAQLSLAVNGVVRQQANIDTMIFQRQRNHPRVVAAVRAGAGRSDLHRHAGRRSGAATRR